ncbi:efflux RND transporter periplasmic adaptor subunit [Demequina sp. NBRC 110057]|uniref:efflux RND transporter periplasmic adaptor subunit n=1 Tax=Demequina sp. NBRC 110057 TaxID=1570346 RepID=UPI000A05FDC1|nr:biotin/lipoyl-binding protein [Demequina sp. NBRC 110057]
MPTLTFNRARVRAWGIPAVALLAGAGLGIGAMALWGPDEAATPEAMGMDAAGGGGQQTVTVGLETLEETVDATGALAAVSSSDLAFEASGTVTKVNVEEGDTVEKGDVIAVIDTLQLTASLREAEASLAQAEATLSNLEDEDDGSDSSEAQIEAAKSQIDVLQENVDDSEDAMSDANLTADISGLVTSQPYEVGDVVSGGSSSGSASDAGASAMGGSTTTAATDTSGVTIVGQDEWTVSVSLTEAEVAEVEEGDQVTFTSEDLEDEFYGIVTDIANLPTTTGGSATYAVELTVTGTVDGLYEGTSVDASIVTLRETDALAIPTNAITTTDGVSTVTVVGDDGTTEEREVTTGDSIGSYTKITDGLSEGEQLQVTVMASSGAGDSEDMMEQFGGEFPGGGELPDGMSFPGGGQMPGGQ